MTIRIHLNDPANTYINITTPASPRTPRSPPTLPVPRSPLTLAEDKRLVRPPRSPDHRPRPLPR